MGIVADGPPELTLPERGEHGGNHGGANHSNNAAEAQSSKHAHQGEQGRNADVGGKQLMLGHAADEYQCKVENQRKDSTAWPAY